MRCLRAAIRFASMLLVLFYRLPFRCRHINQSNFVTALSAGLATHKRILFKRGDTFAAATLLQSLLTARASSVLLVRGRRLLCRKDWGRGNFKLVQLVNPEHQGLADNGPCNLTGCQALIRSDRYDGLYKAGSRP